MRSSLGTAAVVIIATIMLFVFAFGVSLIAFNIARPPDESPFPLIVSMTYFEIERVYLAAFVALGVTTFTWGGIVRAQPEV